MGPQQSSLFLPWLRVLEIRHKEGKDGRRIMAFLIIWTEFCRTGTFGPTAFGAIPAVFSVDLNTGGWMWIKKKFPLRKITPKTLAFGLKVAVKLRTTTMMRIYSQNFLSKRKIHDMNHWVSIL